MQTAQENSAPLTHLHPSSETEQRMILRGVSWATYEQLLADFQDSHAVHFAYDQGVLEIMAPSFEHETIKHTIATLVEILAGEMEIDIEGAGSTTFRREDLARGFEPDACFYIQHAAQVRGKTHVDLQKDPPPDLVIEVDITRPSLNKLPLYASIGVQEIWRYDGQELTVFVLDGGEYKERTESLVLPTIPSEQLFRFIKERQELKQSAWLRRVREWAQQQKVQHQIK